MPPAPNIVQAKPAKIFNKQWPDIILAKRRSANDTTRKLYDTNSIIISKGARAKGAPGGRNKQSMWKPCVLIPIILMAIKEKEAKPNVTTMWLVTVKLKGIIPNKLQKKIKLKIVNKTGK